MSFNLHTHTTRCNHASGTDEEYVLQAIQNGYDVIGFSDHAPYIFPQGHKSGFRIPCDMAQDYADSIRALKEKYRGIIDIKLGFELEYYPDLFNKEIEYLKTFEYDYLILGQHFTDNEYEDYAKYSGSETNSVAVLDKYISQAILGAKSGYFSYIAHPDLINFVGDNDVYIKKMTHFVSRLKEIGIPLEFNFLGFTKGRNYPNDDFWKIVSSMGNDVVIGLDAHSPDVYSDKENLQFAHEYLSKLGIEPMNSITITNHKSEKEILR